MTMTDPERDQKNGFDLGSGKLSGRISDWWKVILAIAVIIGYEQVRDARMSSMEATMTGMQTRLTNVETEVNATRTDIYTLTVSVSRLEGYIRAGQHDGETGR